MSSSGQSDLPLIDLPGIGPGWELLLPARDRARRCTGAVLTEEHRLEVLRTCVQVGTRRAAEAYGYSREAVRAVRSQAIQSGELDRIKEGMGRRALAVADRILDRVEDEVDDLPSSALPPLLSTLTRDGLLLCGSATARVEHVIAGPTHEDINSLIESLPSVGPVVEGENVECICAAAAAGAEDQSSRPNTITQPTGDRASLVLPLSTEESCAPAAHICHTEGLV